MPKNTSVGNPFYDHIFLPSPKNTVFFFFADPKPPKPPADLKVVSSQYDGKHVTIKIVWCASKSNLPIEKYKIIWSLYVNTVNESFISSEAFVKDVRSILHFILLFQIVIFLTILYCSVISMRLQI